MVKPRWIPPPHIQNRFAFLQPSQRLLQLARNDGVDTSKGREVDRWIAWRKRTLGPEWAGRLGGKP